MENFGESIESWLLFYKKHESICNLYFNIVYSPDLDFHNQFQNLIQALEIYHRNKYPDHKSWSNEKFENRKKLVLDKFSGKMKDWLKGLLKHANEPNLHQRLIKLVQETNNCISPLVTDIKILSIIVKS